MITEWFQNLGLDMFGLLAAMLPRFTEFDGVVVTASNVLASVATGAGSLAVWIPWPTVALCMAALLPLYLGSFFFKIIRVVAGHFPLIGGNG